MCVHVCTVRRYYKSILVVLIRKGVIKHILRLCTCAVCMRMCVPCLGVCMGVCVYACACKGVRVCVRMEMYVRVYAM